MITQKTSPQSYWRHLQNKKIQQKQNKGKKLSIDELKKIENLVKNVLKNQATYF
jgi:hypothetical protein